MQVIRRWPFDLTYRTTQKGIISLSAQDFIRNQMRTRGTKRKQAKGDGDVATVPAKRKASDVIRAMPVKEGSQGCAPRPKLGSAVSRDSKSDDCAVTTDAGLPNTDCENSRPKTPVATQESPVQPEGSKDTSLTADQHSDDTDSSSSRAELGKDGCQSKDTPESKHAPSSLDGLKSKDEPGIKYGSQHEPKVKDGSHNKDGPTAQSSDGRQNKDGSDGRDGPQRLGREFYNRPCVVLAKALLGQKIVRMVDGIRLGATIVETEGYLGAIDKAAHSFKGQTDRNKAMFMQPGTAYVYNIYGMYCCLNISSQGEGEAVLIRSVEPTEGVDKMLELRSGKSSSKKQLQPRDLGNGPSKLCMSLGITKVEVNQRDLVTDDTVWLEKGEEVGEEKRVVSKRINIAYAEEWTDKPLRFYVLGNKYVSVRNKEAEKTMTTTSPYFSG